jgi:hypothetical protein
MYTVLTHDKTVAWCININISGTWTGTEVSKYNLLVMLDEFLLSFPH